MKRSDDTGKISGQPPLAELTARYLQQQAAAHADGLAPQPAGDVVPFEAAPVQPVDPRLAWEEAVGVLPHFSPGIQTRSWQAPPQWPQLVAAHEPVVALVFCLGNYPQLVRNFQPLLHAAELTKFRPLPSRPLPVPALVDWAAQTAARRQFPQTLVALGVLRLARQFDTAEELFQAHQAEVPAAWRACWANEAAALAWHQGRAEEAYRQWQSQADSVPVLFNRGMAALFLGQPAQARTNLTAATDQLPEADGWHHLGRLYLTLA